MTDYEIGRINTAMKTKPTQTNLTDKEALEILTEVLIDVPSEFAEPVFKWVLSVDSGREPFRPTVGQLISYMAKLAGAAPITGQRVIAEVRRHITANGANCVPVPGRPACFLPGPPPDLTPQARAFVEARGGWQALCVADIGSEEIYWHEAAKAAAELCEQLKIESVRAASLGSLSSLKNLQVSQ